MGGRWDLLVGVAVVTAVLLIWAAWYYTDSAFKDNLVRFDALSTAATAVGSFLAFIVLVIYTRETYLLRKRSEEQVAAAQLQMENQQRPVVVFELSNAEVALGTPLQLSPPSLRNVGPGPAFNISIGTVKANGHALEFDGVPALLSGATSAVTFYLSANGQRSGLSRCLSNLAHEVTSGTFPSPFRVIVKFDGLSGHYETTHDVLYGGRSVYTTFLGISAAQLPGKEFPDLSLHGLV